MKQAAQSRRRFLRSLLSMAGSSAVPFTVNLAAMGEAAAQSSGEYKALVCLYMAGGNDAFNTVLATDDASWTEYIRLRTSDDGNSSIALPRTGTGAVLPIEPHTSQGRTYALHPAMEGVKQLFENSRAAIIANVGTLTHPTDLDQYGRGENLPPKLFSHNDQQSLWQSNGPEGASLGWGGQLGDLFMANNGAPTFTCISASGNAVFLSGSQVRQFQISTSGMPGITNLSNSLFGVPAASNPLQAVITKQTPNGNPFENEYAAIVSRAIAAQQTLSQAMLPTGTGAGQVPAPSLYINPNTLVAAANPLALQLQTVARIIGGRNALSVKRQVFYVSLGGFDTHDGQKVNQADLLAKISHAVVYFDSVLQHLDGSDLRNQVTLFTASDFGRTFLSNGDGTDHGWGSHHFVFGGAVKGKEIYGAFPQTGIGHSLDVGLGALLPTTSVDQYGATLATWFGVPTNQLAAVFPNIVNFSQYNLGFMA
ncbi:DUF1501 domain-containing protein [Duganella hordei]|uniref:DUF1501 domain-containing protein n=1 Tax=Duganella hordei TaxID=2865934 RepID=UPI0030EA3050